MLSKNQLIEIEITGITSEGSGVGRYDGMAVFIPFSAVGDVLLAKIVKVHKTYAYGIISEILSPSSDRQVPDCPVFQKCGGCIYRHITYKAELTAKETLVKDAFARLGGFKDAPVEPILGCDDIYGYRNKAQYPVAMLDGKAVCGFFSKHSHRVVPFTSCRIQPTIFEAIVNDVITYINDNNIPAYDELKHTGMLRHIYIRQAYHTKQIMVCFVLNSSKHEVFSAMLPLLIEKYPDIKSIVVNINKQQSNIIMGKQNITIWGDNCIEDVMCGKKIVLSPHSFYQVNTRQAEKLYEIAKDYAHLNGNETLIDLYCGAGTIGLSMSDNVKKLIGVEIVHQAIENAEINAKKNHADNAQFICSDAGQAAKKLLDNGESPDVVIVDPPRKGCDELTLDSIIKMSPSRIVMVSCNPSTASRDCRFLCEHGFQISSIKPVDMFPGTFHVETVVLMSRK